MLDKLKKYENIHILFWLIKDSCWMLELKSLAVVMVIPTIIVSFFILFFTRKTPDFYTNLAVFFWICANSLWMLTDFFYQNQYKTLTIIPFALGIVCIGLYYYKSYFGKTNATNQIELENQKI